VLVRTTASWSPGTSIRFSVRLHLPHHSKPSSDAFVRLLSSLASFVCSLHKLTSIALFALLHSRSRRSHSLFDLLTCSLLKLTFELQSHSLFDLSTCSLLVFSSQTNFTHTVCVALALSILLLSSSYPRSGASACTVYLEKGSVAPGVMEWDIPAPPEVANLPKHGYTTAAAGGLSPAYDPSIAVSIPGVFSVGEEFTYVAPAPFVECVQLTYLAPLSLITPILLNASSFCGSLSLKSIRVRQLPLAVICLLDVGLKRADYVSH
jgi:hypothetical protein